MGAQLCQEQPLFLVAGLLLSLLTPALSPAPVTSEGLIAPPVNITVTWTGRARELQVSWEPPATEYTELFIYEILYCIVGSMESPCRKQVHSTRACVLRPLQHGAKYHIRIRTKPDGLSLDGFWGPWSQAVAAETPHSSGEIGLRCFTSDLQWVQCEWTWDSADSNSSHSLFYRSQGSSDASRGQAWQRCQEHRLRPQNTHACTFQPRNDSDIFILVNISRGHPEPALSYFREPFRMHQAVLTSPPRILQANISGGQLRLQWAPPEEELAEYMVYQIRYSVENSLDWKVLQIQHAANSETLDLRAGPCYLLQVRAKPNGQQLQGFWSAWSETIVVEAPSGAGSKDTGEPDAFTASFSVPGWIILSLTITLLFFVGLLGLRCSFPSAYSSVKRKLWPPAPDLHRVLGTFLTDSKQQQANTSFYNKPLEDVILPCLLEVLSERKGAETPPEPTLLKTACPGSAIPEGPEDEDASNLSSPHQDYMVLHPSSPTGSRYENEYLDNRGEGDDIYLRGLAVLLLHVPDAHSELQQNRAEIQYNPQVPSCLQAEHVPLGGPVDSEEEDWECPCSGKQSMSTTDISNQSYLLMRSWEQQPFL
ncbi:thrombopoietin receptor isoform X5 [Gopherus flavomarginatus]|uniref:thrombopoietin receptor isoform X5 n=1 Tax=Gopherus flavomarginatus TaxID=286002 RepID=UPI0021CBA21B|nr:thrombopoietin receptor isoform X5 [Gopherus flavomarginatus]